MDEIAVRAPATVSNVVCGFDCLGFALEEPADLVRLRKTAHAGRIVISHLDDFGLPADAEKNVAGAALRSFLVAANAAVGFEVEITKGIKPGSGVGSSAASSCGAVVAANLLLGQPFSLLELARFAMEGEMLASGARHADNVAPCIFGGFTLVRSAEPLDIVMIPAPRLFASVLHPQIEVRTAEARAMLPAEVPLRTAVRQWSNLGAFVAALAAGDVSLLSRSMEDLIVEPVRSRLIPEFPAVKAAGLAAGAIGGGISGSGPSVFMLSDDNETAEAVASAMADAFSATGIPANIHVSPISSQGAGPVGGNA